MDDTESRGDSPLEEETVPRVLGDKEGLPGTRACAGKVRPPHWDPGDSGRLDADCLVSVRREDRTQRSLGRSGRAFFFYLDPQSCHHSEGSIK